MKFLLSIAVILSSAGVLAQYSDLITQLNALREQVGEVSGQKASFTHQIHYQKDTPYRVEIITEETDEKGNGMVWGEELCSIWVYWIKTWYAGKIQRI